MEIENLEPEIAVKAESSRGSRFLHYSAISLLGTRGFFAFQLEWFSF